MWDKQNNYVTIHVIKKELVKDLQEPERSCLISSFSGMSWMAALIFSLISLTAFCHFKLQWRRSTSQSADTKSLSTPVDWKPLQENIWCTQMKELDGYLMKYYMDYLPKSLLVCMSIGRFWIFCWSETKLLYLLYFRRTNWLVANNCIHFTATHKCTLALISLFVISESEFSVNWTFTAWQLTG